MPFGFEALVFINCLVLSRSNNVLHVHYLGNHLPPHNTLSQFSFHSLNLTYRGILRSLSTFHINPPRVTEEASLVLDFSFTKMRGTSVKVKVIIGPSYVTLSCFGLGFSQTTDCVITGQARKMHPPN